MFSNLPNGSFAISSTQTGIVKSQPLTASVLASLYLLTVLSLTKTLTVLSVSSSFISRTINKIITKLVASVSSVVSHLFYFKQLAISVVNTIVIKYGFFSILTVSVSTMNVILKYVSTSLTVLSTAAITVVAEFVKIFGAVAKYTFIVPSKKLKVSLVKALNLIMTKGQ